MNARLDRLVRQAQADARIPALSVAVHRHDRPLWTVQVGTSGTARPLDADTLFRIGSVTKTFTGVLVMQCRDDGLLELDDPIGRHLDVPTHGQLAIRRLLSHTSGIQREPYGDVWDSLVMPDVERFLDEIARAELVLPPGQRYHYSNLALAMLGHMVAKLRGGTWAEVLAERILAPLGLTSVVVMPGPRAAVGYRVDAYSDHVRPEPPVDFDALGPACQLWATAADLARWAGFLADPSTMDPHGRVLDPTTVDDMRRPATLTDDAVWYKGFGLGLILVPQPDRAVHVGHVGAVPGFLAGVYGRVGGTGTPAACGVAVLGSSSVAPVTLALPHTLLATMMETDPADIAPWQPGPPAPPEFRSMLGPWWSEGEEYVFFWRDGLCARGRTDPAHRPPATFEPTTEPDVLRTVSGREVGERMRLHRDPVTGDVVRLHWATYRFTRS